MDKNIETKTSRSNIIFITAFSFSDSIVMMEIAARKKPFYFCYKEKEGRGMKRLLLYMVVVLADFLLYKWSEQQDGGEWIFALLILCLFALFLHIWKRYSSIGVGLIFITIWSLLMIDSIFYLVLASIVTILFSLMAGLLLIPFYKKHREEVITAWGFVLLNILIQLEYTSEVTLWVTFFITGIGAIIAYYFQLKLVRRCFTVLFLLNACPLLFITLFSNTYWSGFLVIMIVLIFFVLRFNLFDRKSKRIT